MGKPGASAAALILLAGCSASAVHTVPAVTATEQIILAHAEANAVRSLPIDLPRVPTFIDDSDYTGDRYLLGLFTQAVLAAGVPLASRAKSVDVVLVMSPVGSLDSRSYYLGTPPIPVNALFSLPSISAWSKTTDIGIARIRYVAFDRRTGLMTGYASSKFGVSKYSVVKSLLFGAFDYPHLPADRVSP